MKCENLFFFDWRNVTLEKVKLEIPCKNFEVDN